MEAIAQSLSLFDTVSPAGKTVQSIGPISSNNAPVTDPLARVVIGGGEAENPRPSGGNSPLAFQQEGISPFALQQETAADTGDGGIVCIELMPAWSDDRYWRAQGGRQAQSASGMMVNPTMLVAASQVAPLGPAGSWCRPPYEAFIDSSPLADGSVWTLTLIVVFGAATLLITRGWRMPA